MKVKELSTLVAMLAGCTFAKMDSAVKVKAHKAYRALKAKTAEYNEAVKDAGEKFKPEGFDELLSKVRLRATVEDAQRFNAMNEAFTRDVEAATKELGDVELDAPLDDTQKLTEDEFYSVADCNEALRLEQIEQLRKVLC